MSIEPPKTGKALSGPLLLLGFISVLLLVFVAIFGMLAFGDGLPGADDEPERPDPADVLVASEFSIVSSTTEGGTTVLDVDLVVRNTSGERLEDAQVIVQCEDGGYVSAITMIPEITANSETTIRMQLSGTGDPACREPMIAFSSQREST